MVSHRANHTTAAARQLEREVWSAVEAKDGRAAVAACNRLTAEFPDYARGWHTASRLALRLGEAGAGLAAIEKALTLQPDHPSWLLQRAECEARLGRHECLDRTLDLLLARPPGTAHECAGLGLLLTRLERREDALAQYRRAAALKPDQPKHYYNMACLQRTLGQFAEAEDNLDRAIELDPGDYEAWKIRSELRTQTAERNHVPDLKALLEDGIADPRDRAQICYALSKELEDLAQYRDSFHYLKAGADARRSCMRYDVTRDIATMAKIRETFDTGLFESPAPGADTDEPLFVIGMPRTGTTLVERILSSHSAVYSAGELNNFAAAVVALVRKKTDGGRPPSRDALVELSRSLDFEELGETYLRSTRPGTGHSRHFVDKMPLNFLYAGLIRLALPKARIVHVQRHPLDTCFAVYKQLFVDAYPFSYDLRELGRYYAAYERLMRHWNAVLREAIHTVRYEDLVDDIETESRRLLAFCNLDWEPGCLEFHRNPAASATASTVQVRQPVYRSSVGRWREHREQLEPLIEVLEAEGVALDAR